MQHTKQQAGRTFDTAAVVITLIVIVSMFLTPDISVIRNMTGAAIFCLFTAGVFLAGRMNDGGAS